jgi:hypothetical protein
LAVTVISFFQGVKGQLMPDDPHNEVSEERDSDASLVSHQVDEKEVKGIDEDDM